MSERQYLVLVASFIPFGSVRLSLLLKYFQNAKNVWRARKKELLETGLSEKLASSFINHKENFDIEKYFNRLNNLNIRYITIDDNTYPFFLKEIPSPPLVLYIKGEIKPEDKNAVAIVGSRKMTLYGKEVTKRFSEELAGFGVTIVSGLARGIDTEAHKGAIAAGGRTIAVLGCGLHSIYPAENTQFAEIIIENGALVSEYPLGYPVFPMNFAARNRIISGLSKVVLVVEGKRKSGTFLTVGHALDQGKTVFAVPGQITSPLSEAPLYLIKNGARMVTSPKDILDELDMELKVNLGVMERLVPTDNKEEEILKIIENKSLHLDEIARISTLNISGISGKLRVMEIKGLVKNIGNGVYKKYEANNC